jgi:hypothetical protein
MYMRSKCADLDDRWRQQDDDAGVPLKDEPVSVELDTRIPDEQASSAVGQRER